MEPTEAAVSAVPATQRPQCSAGQSGKYLCLRCGWRWSPRRGSPDPPNACSRCRSHYWNQPPDSARANRPDDPKWQAERNTLANRRRARHLARLKELVRELAPVASAVVVKPTLLPPDAEELPLRGDELAKIVLIDVADILAHDRRLSPQISYRRLRYSVRVNLRIENAWQETRSVKPANTSLVLPDWSFDTTSSS
jgi:hypothetical protein